MQQEKRAIKLFKKKKEKINKQATLKVKYIS